MYSLNGLTQSLGANAKLIISRVYVSGNDKWISITLENAQFKEESTTPSSPSSGSSGGSGDSSSDSCTRYHTCSDGTQIKQCEIASNGMCGCKAVNCPSTNPTVPSQPQPITSIMPTKMCGDLIYVYTSNFFGKPCPHCEMQAPVIKELAGNFNCLKIEWIDAYFDSDRANKLGVTGYPTMIFTKGGCTRQKVGYTNYESLKDWIYYGACSTSSSGNTTSDYGGDMGICLANPTNYWDQETNKCYPGFSPEIIKKSCSDPDGGMNKYQIAHTFGFRSYYANDKDKRIRTGGKDACLSNNQLVEHYCDENGFIQTAYLDCPNGCNENGCIKGEEITEKVTCTFIGADQTQKCYSAEDNSKFYCSGIGSCIADVKDQKGEKITWKSSCGGYAYTVVDGNDKTVTFNCKGGETNATEIINRGFRLASWQCYDGKEEKQGGESSCKPSGLWQKYAKEFCDGHCSKETGKCGVNSFAVFKECYSDVTEIPSVLPAIPETTSFADCDKYSLECKTGNSELCKKWEINCKEKYANTTQLEEALICKDSCPLNGKCYPFGYRKSSEYCSDSGAFVSQLAGNEKCDNNFECNSNVCVSGNCVSQGVIDKFFSWFKKLFGA
jgi:thiol-disulfide isomerase/thioredoxin